MSSPPVSIVEVTMSGDEFRSSRPGVDLLDVFEGRMRDRQIF